MIKIKELLTESTDVASSVKKFVDNLTKKYPDYTFDFKKGKTYIKILSGPPGRPPGSAWGFVSLFNSDETGIKVGDLLKAASFNAPAKGARGNILDGSAKYDKYGPEYKR